MWGWGNHQEKYSLPCKEHYKQSWKWENSKNLGSWCFHLSESILETCSRVWACVCLRSHTCAMKENLCVSLPPLGWFVSCCSTWSLWFGNLYSIIIIKGGGWFFLIVQNCPFKSLAQFNFHSCKQYKMVSFLHQCQHLVRVLLFPFLFLD